MQAGRREWHHPTFYKQIRLLSTAPKLPRHNMQDGGSGERIITLACHVAMLWGQSISFIDVRFYTLYTLVMGYLEAPVGMEEVEYVN